MRYILLSALFYACNHLKYKDFPVLNCPQAHTFSWTQWRHYATMKLAAKSEFFRGSVEYEP